MIKELFETGKSVDAAIDSACEKLGCSREDCEWEIIDLPKKGFLGLKNIPAKVRVSIDIPDEKPARPTQPENRPRQQQPARPAQPENRAVKNQPARPEQAAADERPKRERTETPPQPRAARKTEPLKPEEISEKERLARDYLAEVFEAAGLKADYVITHEHGGSYINIVGEGLGMVIGRRGETLDAIQYLAGLVANRGEGEYLRLTVDCGDYRLKRKGTLEDLAKKLASQVLRTNISKTLEPMNPFERRIIHATVSEIEGVSSSSIGEEPNRRVVITAPGAKPAPRGGYAAERGGYNRDRAPRRDFRPRDGSPESGERPERGGFGRDRRDRDGRRDSRRDDGGGRPPRQAQPAPQGPPKQTPETEATSGISFGKIDL